jgi:hypothetical protein
VAIIFIFAVFELGATVVNWAVLLPLVFWKCFAWSWAKMCGTQTRMRQQHNLSKTNILIENCKLNFFCQSTECENWIRKVWLGFV